MKKYILALDEGTTSARAILFDRNSNIIAMAQNEITQIYPAPGWVEQDPMDIYSSQYAALTECITKSGISSDEIAAIGITNQRETVIAWDRRTGKPICNAIVWQCRRTADLCEKLEKDGYADYINDTTGLRLDPYFSGTKIKWILDNVSGARELSDAGELLIGTVDTFIIWKLTDGKVFVTDRTNASRTMLFNIHTCAWDEKLLELFGVPRTALPEVKSSSEIYGYFECMGANIPIAGIAGERVPDLLDLGQKRAARRTMDAPFVDEDNLAHEILLGELRSGIPVGIRKPTPHISVKSQGCCREQKSQQNFFHKSPF